MAGVVILEWYFIFWASFEILEIPLWLFEEITEYFQLAFQSWADVRFILDFSDCAPFFTIFLFRKTDLFCDKTDDHKMIHIYLGRVLFKGCSKRWRRLNLFVENSGCVFLPIRHTQKNTKQKLGSFQFKKTLLKIEVLGQLWILQSVCAVKEGILFNKFLQNTLCFNEVVIPWTMTLSKFEVFEKNG